MNMDTDVDEADEQWFYPAYHVTPLVEIFNVRVHGNINKHFRLYGKIMVKDRRGGRTLSIYHRTKDNPQSIVSGDKLLLTVKDGRLDNAVIILSKELSLDVELSAISRHGNTITLRGNITLDRNTSEDDWSSDEFLVKPVQFNNNWNAEVHYAVYPFAITATVRVLLFSKDDDFDSFEETVSPDDESAVVEDHTAYDKNNCSHIIKFYGSVYASAVVSGNDDCQMSLLFSKPIEDCVEVQSGRFIDLSRSVVAVPAHSSLQIEAAFFDGDSPSEIAKGKLVFKPDTAGITYKKDFKGSNGRIRVQVVWSNAYKQLYRNKTRDMCRNKYPQRQRAVPQQDVPKQPYPATLNDDGLLPSFGIKQPLLELYSVVVCGKNGKPFKFYGTVTVTDSFYPECVLIDKSRPLACPKSGISIIARGPTLYGFSLLDVLGIRVDIRDASTDAVVSRGVVDTWTHNMDLLANRRICSIVRGKQGFAAVHYSIFYPGVSALVNIKLIDKCLPCIIKGEIYAQYGNCEPGRCYQDKLFKNFLFCDEDHGVRINDSESTLPLLKPVVSLPIHSFLVIEAHLSISPITANLAEDAKPLNGNATFYKNEDFPRKIGNGDFYLDVSVEFPVA